MKISLRKLPQIEIDQLVELFNSERYVALEASTQQLIKRYPESGFVWKILGTALGIQGKNAIFALQKAAQFLPKDAEAHYNLGLALQAHGLFGDAVASYHRALALLPNDADTHNDLGNALQELGRHDDAVASYRRALTFKPKFAEAHNKLGCALHDLRYFDQAIASYCRALEIQPNYAEAHNNLGLALQAIGQPKDALVNYRQALNLEPGYAVAHNNLGNVLQELGKLDDAVASFKRALSTKRDYAEAHYNLGNAQKELGLFDAAIASYKEALKINPTFAKAQSNLLFTLNFTSRYPRTYCLDEARAYGRMVARHVKKRFTSWRCAAIPQRLRVGFVSGDLRNHPVAFFLEGILAQFDATQIELIAYPTTHHADEVTKRLKAHFSRWKPIANISDEAAAGMIHADGIHILFDLSGHSQYERLPLFAWKPAPIQVTWLGYFATTGVAEIDYLLTDETGVPKDQQAAFTESIWYLPDTRLCFSAPQFDLSVSPLPALENKYITFACFQNLAKVGGVVLDVWSKILNAIPDARLRFASKQLDEPTFLTQFLRRLQQHGLDLERVSLNGAALRERYLAFYAEVDVVLDTFPYPGGTTTCEALWMGVPTLSLAGDTLLARQCTSLLTAAGLTDWVATSRAQYIEKAIYLTSDLTKLAALRANLRAQVLASPIYDAQRFSRNFEAALWGMWRKYQGLEIPKNEPM